MKLYKCKTNNFRIVPQINNFKIVPFSLQGKNKYISGKAWIAIIYQVTYTLSVPQNIPEPMPQEQHTKLFCYSQVEELALCVQKGHNCDFKNNLLKITVLWAPKHSVKVKNIFWKKIAKIKMFISVGIF